MLRRRHLVLTAACGLGGTALRAGAADAPPAPTVPDGERWRRIQASFFEGRPIAPADAAQLQLEAPARAVDGAFVPVTVRTGRQPLRRLTLVVDENPGPVAAVFEFGPRAGRADIETRLRVDAYSMVRAIAETADGRLVMAQRFVKASGGCSAPAGADAAEAEASMGRQQLRVDAPRRGQPAQASWQISHPNHSGLAMDQVSRLYTPAHFVRRLDLSYAGAPVLHAELDFALSENPTLRFQFVPDAAGELRAEAEDTQGRRWTTTLAVEPAP